MCKPRAVSVKGKGPERTGECDAKINWQAFISQLAMEKRTVAGVFTQHKHFSRKSWGGTAKSSSHARQRRELLVPPVSLFPPSKVYPIEGWDPWTLRLHQSAPSECSDPMQSQVTARPTPCGVMFHPSPEGDGHPVQERGKRHSWGNWRRYGRYISHQDDLHKIILISLSISHNI